MSLFRTGLYLFLFLILGTAQIGADPGDLSMPELPHSLEEVAAGVDFPDLVRGTGSTRSTFEENLGQYPDYIAYVWNGATLILRDGSHVVLSNASETSVPGRFQARFLRTEMIGGQAGSYEGRKPAAGTLNYLRGAETTTDVSLFREVAFQEIYDGIDLIYRDHEGRLKYDFVVAPGRDSAVIQMRFPGATDVRIGQEGELILDMPGRQIVHKRPFAFERAEGSSQTVEASYRLLNGGSVGFTVERVHPDRELVIDPEIIYSTYLGGSATYDLEDFICTLNANENDSGRSIAVDAEGRAIVGGITCSIDFPLENPFQNALASVTFESQTDGFVTRFAPDGQTLDFSTYFGGADFDEINAVAVGPGDSFTVAGRTSSEDLQLESPLYDVLSDGFDSTDAFVTVFASNGQSLDFSTYLGGTEQEDGLGVAVGPNGEIAVVGVTESEDFPTENAFQGFVDGEDAFVTVIAPDFSSLTFSTHLGSSEDDLAHDVAIDLLGRVVVIGSTLTTPFGGDPFPDVNALKPTNDNFLSDAFLASFEPDGTPVFVTLLGGPENDYGHAVALDSQGQIFAAGTTGGDLFPEPTEGVFQPGYGGGADTFVIKVGATGQDVLYSTYYGGPNGETVRGIAVDAYGAAVLVGEASGDDIPIVMPIQESFGGGGRDVFVAKLTTEADALLFSTYLGGATDDSGNDVALDLDGSTYLTGFTISDDYPVEQPYQEELLGIIDAVVTKLGESVADFRYEYATKVICGEQEDPESLVLTRGAYATTVNIHSPGRERARFRKKLALAIPPGSQSPGAIVPISFDALDYDEALATDCDDLRTRIAGVDPNDESGALGADYFEGFVVLQSTDPLDVTAVYTSADIDASGLARNNASIDIEEVSERDRIRPTDLAITKQAFRLPSIIVSDMFQYFFIGYLVTVSNLGDVEAYDVSVKDFLSWNGAFMVLPLEPTFLIDNSGTLTLDSWLPILPSAGNAELTAEFPTLGPGETAAFAYWTIGLRQLDQAPTSVIDTVLLTSANEDSNPGNNTAVVVTDL